MLTENSLPTDPFKVLWELKMGVPKRPILPRVGVKDHSTDEVV
jgi:hypothetical protein